MISDTRRTASRFNPCWNNAGRPPSPSRISRRGHRLHRREVKEKPPSPEQKARQRLSKKNIGPTRLVSSVAAWDIQRRTARMATTKTTRKLVQARKKVSRSWRRGKEQKKAFAQLKKTQEDLDIFELDSSQGESHFQVTGDGFQFTQVQSDFEPRTAQLFKQAQRSNMKLALREIILSDIQSTMDLICNPTLVKKIVRSSTKTQLKSNGGSMKVNHKATRGITRKPLPTYLP
jgi:hypothetical protein